jgi:cell division protein ZapA (FtsZ GTPase activity inhibitor)
MEQAELQMPAEGDEGKEITVTVLGETYKLQGEGGLKHLKRVASLVEKSVNEVTREYPQAGPKRATVLAALNIADELCRERALRLQDQEQWRAGTRTIIEALETELRTTPGPEET